MKLPHALHALGLLLVDMAGPRFYANKSDEPVPRIPEELASALLPVGGGGDFTWVDSKTPFGDRDVRIDLRKVIDRWFGGGVVNDFENSNSVWTSLGITTPMKPTVHEVLRLFGHQYLLPVVMSKLEGRIKGPAEEDEKKESATKFDSITPTKVARFITTSQLVVGKKLDEYDNDDVNELRMFLSMNKMLDANDKWFEVVDALVRVVMPTQAEAKGHDDINEDAAYTEPDVIGIAFAAIKCRVRGLEWVWGLAGAGGDEWTTTTDNSIDKLNKLVTSITFVNDGLLQAADEDAIAALGETDEFNKWAASRKLYTPIGGDKYKSLTSKFTAENARDPIENLGAARNADSDDILDKHVKIFEAESSVLAEISLGEPENMLTEQNVRVISSTWQRSIVSVIWLDSYGDDFNTIKDTLSRGGVKLHNGSAKLVATIMDIEVARQLANVSLLASDKNTTNDQLFSAISGAWFGVKGIKAYDVDGKVDYDATKELVTAATAKLSKIVAASKLTEADKAQIEQQREDYIKDASALINGVKRITRALVKADTVDGARNVVALSKELTGAVEVVNTAIKEEFGARFKQEHALVVSELLEEDSTKLSALAETVNGNMHFAWVLASVVNSQEKGPTVEKAEGALKAVREFMTDSINEADRALTARAQPFIAGSDKRALLLAAKGVRDEFAKKEEKGEKEKKEKEKKEQAEEEEKKEEKKEEGGADRPGRDLRVVQV